jgi:hypothetical protein
MDQRGILLRIAIVRQMAGILAAQRVESVTIKPIGEKCHGTGRKRQNLVGRTW